MLALIARATARAGAVPWRISTPCRASLHVQPCGEDGSSDTKAAGAAAAPAEQPRIKIYTRTGDKGTSSLFSGERRAKSDGVFEALGSVDEVACAIGLAREAAPSGEDLAAQLVEIQSRLLDLGSHIATPRSGSSDARLQRAAFAASHVDELEAWIDRFDAELPPLRNFILPSGGACAAHLHLARAVCRRAERAVTVLVAAAAVEPVAGMYLNRLSDYLFTAARVSAKRDGKPEQVYQKAKAR